MAGTINRLFGFLLVAITLMHSATAQTTHVVGGTTGWTVPSPATIGRHDVATVTQAVYDACDGTSTIGAIQMTSPVTIRLASPGTQYYFCTFQGHCSLGQKLTTTPPPRSSPPPTPTTVTPPPRSSPPPTTTTIVAPPTTSATPSRVSPPTPAIVGVERPRSPSLNDVPMCGNKLPSNDLEQSPSKLEAFFTPTNR
ncbi:hypothetical protein ACHQM5_005772 [Ranunculus cassubicifolius]